MTSLADCAIYIMFIQIVAVTSIDSTVLLGLWLLIEGGFINFKLIPHGAVHKMVVQKTVYEGCT